MAVTFENFFRGLAEAAPTIADLIYKRSIYLDQREEQLFQRSMQEREMASKEKTAESQRQFYEAQTESVKLSDAQSKEIQPYLVATKKVELATQDITYKMQQGKVDAIVQKYGSLSNYMAQQVGYEMEDLRLRLENIKANTANLGLQQWATKQNVMLQQSQYIVNLADLASTASPDTQKEMDNILSSPDAYNKDGTINFGKVTAGVSKLYSQGKIKNPDFVKAMYGLDATMSSLYAQAFYENQQQAMDTAKVIAADEKAYKAFKNNWKKMYPEAKGDPTVNDIFNSIIQSYSIAPLNPTSPLSMGLQSMFNNYPVNTPPAQNNTGADINNPYPNKTASSAFNRFMEGRKNSYQAQNVRTAVGIGKNLYDTMTNDSGNYGSAIDQISNNAQSTMNKLSALATLPMSKLYR